MADSYHKKDGFQNCVKEKVGLDQKDSFQNCAKEKVGLHH